MSPNKIKITQDPFSPYENIDWQFVAGRIPSEYGFNFEDAIVTGANNDNFSKLIFSPVNKNQRNFIKIRLQKKFFNPKKFDSITFLFQSGEFETFVLMTNAVEIMNHNHWGKILEILVPITVNQLEKFRNDKFTSWKFKSGNNELLFREGVAFEPFRPFEKLQSAIKQLFTDYLAVIESRGLNIDNIQSDEHSVPCFLYVMKDLNNVSYKIGISNSPEYRERTLQSDKPSIELLTTKQFPKRKIALVFEKVLHEYFKNKRIRGEWFILDKDDLIDLKSILG